MLDLSPDQGSRPAAERDAPERVFDPLQIDAALHLAIHEAPEPRAAAVAALRPVIREARARIENRFTAEQDGDATVRLHSELMDTVIGALFGFAVGTLFPAPNPSSGERLAVVAVGGYGRGELAPYSDIDLLFLFPYKLAARTEQVVEFLLYVLWDLGFKVGHATRSVEDTLRQAQADITIRTAVLEARLICGDADLATTLERRFIAEIVSATKIEFVDAKLAERDERHGRTGDSRYVLEPNIKEGKGGLRDLHGLFWIARYIYGVHTLGALVSRQVLLPEEAHKFARARTFLWTVRCHLHYLTGRAEERLTFDVQGEIGRRMGYTDHAGTRGVERFMKHYFLIAKDVGDLTRIFIAALEAEQKRAPRPEPKRGVSLFRRLRPAMRARLRSPTQPDEEMHGFILDGGRLSVRDASSFQGEPVNLIRLFHTAQVRKLEIHPYALRLVTQSLRLIDGPLRNDAHANALFMEILTSPTGPETTLRQMNEAGVLGRFIPEFGRVVAQMQYDMYHVYTVDEHTLFAIGMLHRIETGALADELPVATAIVQDIPSRRALYVAVMLHDIAKGRGTDHSEEGAKIALRLGPRLGLTPEETETASWLVKYHLLMSRVAFKRDVDDPKTIHDFVGVVQSPERLKLLTLLTAADIRAVGPNVWNGWKGALLRELYESSVELLSGGLMAEGHEQRIRRQQEAARGHLPDFSEAEFAAFCARAYPYYWLSTDVASLARHARLMREAEASGAPLTVASHVDPARSVTEITLYTGDHVGLFSRIAGALALAGASIVDARIATMANGMALDTFWVQDAAGGAFDRPDKLARLSVLFENVLSGRLNPVDELKRAPAFPSRARVFTVQPRAVINNAASTLHTVIEVNGRDRPALLFDLTRCLTRQNLQIACAKISTYGEKVVDVFYVKDVFGLKVTDEARCERIRKALIAVISEEKAGA